MNSHPFSTRKFLTDGRTIFLESASTDDDARLVNLKTNQYELKHVIERTFKDLDLNDETVSRWRPFHGKSSIVIDPLRSFGQPIASKYGVPTAVLFDAVSAEGTVEKAATVYEVSVQAVRDAVAFEELLMAA